MHYIYSLLKSTFSERFDNTELQKKIWQDVMLAFSPVLSRDDEQRFSFQASSEAGDLGTALLWIVQSSLINGIKSDILQDTGPAIDMYQYIMNLPPSYCGALAHNDDRNNPVIINRSADMLLNGRKMYVTGGELSEFFFVTAREQGDDKVSCIMVIESGALPRHSLEPLDLNALKTVSHARLNFDNYRVSPDVIIPLDARSIRRTIRRWSIIERSLISEAVLGLIGYLNRETARITQISPVKEHAYDQLVDMQKNIVNRQIRQALNHEMIIQDYIDFTVLQQFIERIESTCSEHESILPQSLHDRVRDLLFVKRLAGIGLG